ncbi:hypothetical protein DFH09DRAFT_1079540 [Mycena vulgaris]|nr:hypothetical protein DFH09DRAFT_1079540 [Mycena vulgaris]
MSQRRTTKRKTRSQRQRCSKIWLKDWMAVKPRAKCQVLPALPPSPSSSIALDMPLVAAALTFGSFGDILEAARIAKRMMDVLRKGGGSPERQKLISTLKAICEDLSWLMVLPKDRFATRLRDELLLCRSLLGEFYAKIKSYEGPLGWLRMTVLEETELVFWRAQISERREALRDLFGPITIMQLHDVRFRIDEVKHTSTMNVEPWACSYPLSPRRLMNFFLAEVSRMESEIRTDVQAIQQAFHKISPHSDISDPHFYVRNPLGEPIHIPLSQYRNFNDLDLILRAYCNRPDVGSTYVERGDYSIVSSDGEIIPRLRLGGQLRVGVVFEISIIKRKRLLPDRRRCPRCGQSNQDPVEVQTSHVGRDIKFLELKKFILPKYLGKASQNRFRKKTRQNRHCEFLFGRCEVLSIFCFEVACEFSARLMRLRCLSRPDSASNSSCLTPLGSAPNIFTSTDGSPLPDPSGFFFQQRAPPDPSAFFQQMRNEVEQLIANVNREDEIDSEIQSVPQIYEISDEEYGAAEMIGCGGQTVRAPAQHEGGTG